LFVIRVFETEPALLPIDNEDISQINECDLVVTSGKIVIGGTMDYFPEAKRLELANGTYRVRIYYFNLDSINEDELSGNDHYEVELWPTSEEKGIRVIK
jgi:hypothetical protein